MYYVENGKAPNTWYYSWNAGLVHYVAMSTEIPFGISGNGPDLQGAQYKKQYYYVAQVKYCTVPAESVERSSWCPDGDANFILITCDHISPPPSRPKTRTRSALTKPEFGPAGVSTSNARAASRPPGTTTASRPFVCVHVL